MSYDRTLKYLIEDYSQAIVQWLLNIIQESVVYQKIIREGLEQGRRSEVKLIMRLLQRRLGKIGIEIQNQIQDLSFTQLEDLGEALLDFQTEADLINWLSEHFH